MRDAHENAEKMWNAVLEAGEEFGLMVIAPAHHKELLQAFYHGDKT